ncbi:MAG: PP2C family protein-serine/threonine phosphatase, partial [bacterium]|nr:PP2C family protein-serine/threonine phosphatase [bacterium]
ITLLYLPYTLLVQETLSLRVEQYVGVLELNLLGLIVGRVIDQRNRAEVRMLEASALERELQVARKVQQSLLPKRIEIAPGYDIGAFIAYARTVGGDYYDVFPLEEDVMALSIADVSGKGMPAALLVALTKYTIRGSAVARITPEEVFRAVNDVILSATTPSMFVSAIYGILFPLEGRLVYANSGHELPLLWKAISGNVHRTPAAGGIVLGVTRNVSPIKQELYLAPGDVLLMFTDGAIEARDHAGEIYGNKRLYASLAANAHLPAQMIVEAIKDELFSFSGGKLYDDITLLALKRSGEESITSGPESSAR